MADRSSAEIFGKVFRLLAENPTDENKALARKLYAETSRYDFSDDQMDADGACRTLGISLAVADED